MYISGEVSDEYLMSVVLLVVEVVNLIRDIENEKNVKDMLYWRM